MQVDDENDFAANMAEIEEQEVETLKKVAMWQNSFVAPKKYCPPDDGSTVLAQCVLRAQSGIGEVLKALAQDIIPSTLQGKSLNMVVQTIRLSKAEQDEIVKAQTDPDENVTSDVSLMPPSCPLAPSYTRYSDSEIPGQIGALRFTMTMETQATETLFFDATVPCMFIEDATNTDVKNCKPPIGLNGPSVLVEGMKFVTRLKQCMDKMVAGGSPHCVLIIAKNGITINVKLANPITVSNGDNEECIQSEDVLNEFIPFVENSDGANHDYAQVTVIKPIAGLMETHLAARLDHSNIKRIVDTINGSAAGKNANGTSNFSLTAESGVSTSKSDANAVKLSFDFTFVPPSKHRQVLGWQCEDYLGRGSKIGEFSGYLCHMEAFALSTSSVATTIWPFEQAGPVSSLPSAAYEHVKTEKYFEPDCSEAFDDIESTWVPFFGSEMPGTIPKSDNISDFCFGKQKLIDVFGAVCGVTKHTVAWLPKDSSSSVNVSPSLLICSIFNDAKKKEGAQENNQQKSYAKTKPGICDCKTERKSSPSVLLVGMVHLEPSGSGISSARHFVSKGNPIYRKTLSKKHEQGDIAAMNETEISFKLEKWHDVLVIDKD